MIINQQIKPSKSSLIAQFFTDSSSAEVRPNRSIFRPNQNQLTNHFYRRLGIFLVIIDIVSPNFRKVTIIQLSNLLKVYECYLPKCRDRINSIKHVVPNNFDNPDIIFDLMSEFVYEFMYDTFELYLFSNHIDCGEAFNKMFNDMNKLKEKLQFYVGNINVTFKWININVSHVS